MSALSIRKARLGDEDVILGLLRELAEYENLLGKFKITREAIARDFLSERPLCHCDLAFEGGEVAGIASWYWTYASFAAARGIYLEDLYVRPAFRGRGYGKAFLAMLAAHANEAGASRVEWSVLDWNKPSIDFYESIGARRHGGWCTYRLEGEALINLAAT